MEHLLEAKKVGDREYFSYRGEVNDKRFIEIEKKLESFDRRIAHLEKMVGNHMTDLAKEIKEIKSYLSL